MIILYLKSLEIQGFKSFPEKTRLTFEKPITGIVGPNGSGKSNISDAVLWVMGEQSSRSLRGGKMEDVIFGGTQRRAQLGFAEVSLVIDNSDEVLGLDSAEVMITRRYYRSGESEYYINRSLVRLKDVHELLMDTGLGREGYSIIGQGKIAEILSTKSKDRREIFEEAAGISRYRHRKDESQRKLLQTDENLLRIGDKISELELQIDPLREQAEVAKKFLLLRDELRGLEISVWMRELESLRVRAEEAEKNHISMNLTLDAATRELENYYEETESASEKMQRCEVELESVRNNISSAETRQSDLGSAAAVLRSQLEGNAAQIERLNQELRSRDEQHDGVGEQISSREKRLLEIADEKKALDAQTDLHNGKLHEISSLSGSSAQKLGEKMRSVDDLQDTLNETRAGLSALASQAQELYDRENAIKQELAAASESLTERAGEHEKSLGELEKVREETTVFGNVISGLTIKSENKAKKFEAAGEKRDRISHELKTLESRHSLLSEMEKEYQGYSKAVKLIMQDSARGALNNIHGTVAALLRTDDKYAAAIETALGGAVQNIIVATEEDARAAIKFLKSRDGGRATFLPISTINGVIINEDEVCDDDGFEGVAINLVEYDEQYAQIYANLLGRVVVADDLGSAIRIAKKHGHKFKIVTLDGQVINAGGSMTGGSAVSRSGVISRTNELKLLDERIKSHRLQLEQAADELSECDRERIMAENELESAQGELSAAREKLIRQESEESVSLQLLQSVKESIVILSSELDSINQRIAQNGEETLSARERIAALEEQAETIKVDIEETTHGQERLSEERERVNALLSEARANCASLDAEKAALEKAVSELTTLRDEMHGSRERQLETVDDLKNQSNQIRAEILEKERLSAIIANEIDSQKNRLSELNVHKLEIESERISLNKSIQEKNKEIMDFERECSRLEQKRLTAQMEEKQILDNLWDTYELSRTAAANAAAPLTSLAAAQKSISAIKLQIKELGSPNIGAIEEFDRVNSRYTYLTSQRDDVEKAKSELTGIIDDITAQMREIFLKEFAVINESFEKTFIELFGGGRASLVLEDADDVLECGIDIQVQPPGKSLKTLTLLSGGEKAFVAIAIYFAILTVRPPPFVVMDEIEAALDDANVMRFSEHMRRMSSRTQVIVITHKRVTMEESDVLYGITMQELGVSSVLKIDLDEAEKHIKEGLVVRS